jgi:hypothetical protein
MSALLMGCLTMLSVNLVYNVLYVQVTVHRDNLHINNQQDVSSIQKFTLSRNSTCFGHLLCPSSGVISCTRSNWYVSCMLCGRCLGESGWKRPHNLHETYQLPRVQLITPDDGHRRCPKHEVSWQNKILDTWCIFLDIYTKIYTVRL